MKRLRFHPDALAEYQAAAVWYGYEGARRFMTIVDGCIDELTVVPDAGSLWPGSAEIRRRVLPRVPYSVIYLVGPDEIVIVAVAHHKRRPGYWAPRLGRR